MSDDYTTFSDDLNGDGVEDPAAIYTLDDGSNVLVGDLDGNGQADFAAVDSNGDGVYEASYNALTGEYTDLTTDATTGTATGTAAGTTDTADLSDTADYDGSGGNLDGDVAAYDAEATGTDTTGTDTASSTASSTAADNSSDTGSTGGYYNAAAVSDMLAAQHETNMAIINNI